MHNAGTSGIVTSHFDDSLIDALSFTPTSLFYRGLPIYIVLLFGTACTQSYKILRAVFPNCASTIVNFFLTPLG